MKTGTKNPFVVYPQHLIEALKKLQTQTSQNATKRVYIYDLIDQRTIYSSCPLAGILGYTAKAIHTMGPEMLARLIHPDELEAVSEHYQNFVSLKSGQVISIDYRMRQADGTWCLLHSQETPWITALDGTPLQILGMTQIVSPFSTAEPKNESFDLSCLDDMN